MYSVGDTVMYRNEGACTVVEIREEDFSGVVSKYYLLRPVFRPSATLFVPIDNELLVSRMKPIISEQEAEKAISDSLLVSVDWIENAEERKKLYREAFDSSSRLDLIAAVKMVRKYRDSSDKYSRKPHVFDLQFIRNAERCIEEELNIVLGMKKEDVQEIFDK